MTPDRTELYYAEMEAARNSACDAFFEARPRIDRPERRETFKDGFERGFAPLWNRLQAVERERDRLASLSGNLLTQQPTLETRTGDPMSCQHCDGITPLGVLEHALGCPALNRGV